MKCRGISNDNILHTCYMLIRCNISIKKFFKKLPGVFYIISSLSVKIFCNTVIVQEWWRFYSLPTLDKKVSQVADMALKLTSMKNPWQKRTVDDLKCLVTWLVTPMKLLNKRSWKNGACVNLKVLLCKIWPCLTKNHFIMWIVQIEIILHSNYFLIKFMWSYKVPFRYR